MSSGLIDSLPLDSPTDPLRMGTPDASNVAALFAVFVWSSWVLGVFVARTESMSLLLTMGQQVNEYQQLTIVLCSNRSSWYFDASRGCSPEATPPCMNYFGSLNRRSVKFVVFPFVL